MSKFMGTFTADESLGSLTFAFNRLLSLMDKAENRVGVGRHRSLPECSLMLLINMGPLKIKCNTG